MLQIGELYLVKELFELLFPTKELVNRLAAWSGPTVRVMALEAAKYLSERYSCNVFVVETNTYVVLLEVDEDERFYKLLDCNGNVGWIYCWDFSRYFEFVKE